MCATSELSTPSHTHTHTYTPHLCLSRFSQNQLFDLCDIFISVGNKSLKFSKFRKTRSEIFENFQKFRKTLSEIFENFQNFGKLVRKYLKIFKNFGKLFRKYLKNFQNFGKLVRKYLEKKNFCQLSFRRPNRVLSFP